MSDYIPHPDTEMHINQMPEECLRLLFIQLPLLDQLKAGNVCQLWRTVRDALFLTQKSLTIQIADYPYNEDKNYLIITGLNEEGTATLVAMFPNIRQLTIYTTKRILVKEESSQVAHLLAQYRHQLVTLYFQSEDSSSLKDTPNGSLFFDVINTMPKLKQLSLGFLEQALAPFDLPILRQLDKLDFACLDISMSIITLWAPHLEARSSLMEIDFDIYDPTYAHNDRSALYDSITPKVASMFTGFIKFEVNLEQFQRLSTRFTNLTKLSLIYFGDANTNSFAVPALMQAIANLKQLTTLCIDTCVLNLDVQPRHGRLPQLPTIKEWYIKLYGEGELLYSHDLLSAWTANLGWLFPNLKDLTIGLGDFTGCTDCGFVRSNQYHAEEMEAMKAQVEDCLRLQLDHIKQQQCPKLSKAKIKYMDGFSGPKIAITLKDLAN